jgi:hypothetical protein
MLTHNIMSRRFKTSPEANAKLTELQRFSGFRDHVLSRIALSVSLSIQEPPPLVEVSKKGGKELRGETFFRIPGEPTGGWFLPYFTALVVEHHGRPLEREDEIGPLIEAHWERGIAELHRLVQERGTWAGALQHLARHAAGQRRQSASPLPMPSSKGKVSALTVEVGHPIKGGDPLRVTFNDAKAWNNPHIAIAGMSGTGKTQFAKQVISGMVRASGGATHFIFLDYAKGDVSSDTAFVRATGAKVFTLPGDILPISPFKLPHYSEEACRLAAEDKRECYRQLITGLGPKQEGRLADAIFDSYECREGDPHTVPDFDRVREVLLERYAQDELGEDILTEVFRRLTTYKLFWSRNSNVKPVDRLTQVNWIIDIHSLSGLQEIVAFTVIEQLYREMRLLPDAPVDPETGLRETRCILALDEAHHYLPKKNKFLQGLIREGRSKGIVILLLSQSPDDFEQKDFDYTEQLEFVFLLGCKTKPKAVERLLGCGNTIAKDFSIMLGKMGPFEGVARRLAPGKTDPQRLTVLPFFQGEGRTFQK